MRKFLLIIAFLISVVGLNAQDVGDNTIIDYEGYSLQFTVTNVEPAECEVICSTQPTEPTAITIPSFVEIKGVECGVTSIGDWAFAYSRLTSIEIPNSMTSIGNEAFSGCSGLTNVKCHAEDVPETDENAFSNCLSNMTIQVPANSLSLYQDAGPWNNYNIVALLMENGRWLYYDNGISESAFGYFDPNTGTPTQTFWAIMFPTEVIAEYAGKRFTKVAMYDNSAHKGTFSIHFGGDDAPGEMVHIQSYETKGERQYVEFELEKPVEITGNDNIWIQFSNEYGSGEYPTAYSADMGDPNSRWTSGDGSYWYDSNFYGDGMYGTWMIRALVDDVDNLEQPDGPVLNVGLGYNTIIDYDGYSLKFTVTSVESAECEGICSTKPATKTAITIPSSIEIHGRKFSVTSIGSSSFYGCSSLTSIEIPNSVISIGDNTFAWCSKLTNIEIPNSVTYIGSGVFWRCDGLTNIEIPSSVTSIGSYAFEYCSNLTSIEIPNSVTSIGDQAFAWCSNLTSIEIPNSVTSIRNWAFSWCSNLTTIKCHAESVPETYESAFYDCPSDMTIQVPANSLSLYQAAEPWNNYNIVALPDVGDNTIIDYDGYSLQFTVTNVEPAECEVKCSTNPTTETAITIPSSVEIKGVECSVTSIGDYAFNQCSRLTSIEIPNSVTSIGDYAFNQCFRLTSIEIPNSVTSIGDWAFVYSSLTRIEIPNSVTSIGDNVFLGCFNLTSIEIPNSVTSIGDQAFWDCPGLTSIEIPNSVITIGDEAFYGCYGLTSIEIPNSVTFIGDNAFSFCTALETLEVETGNTVYDSRDNCNAIIETETNTLVVGCKNTVIPNNVTSIGDNAFSGCTGLTSIAIPNSVTSIGDNVFLGCFNLTSIEIPNSVTSIGGNAFASSNLATIKCHAEEPPVVYGSIGSGFPSNIQVPNNSVEKYKATYPWKYCNITQMYPHLNEYFTVINYGGYSLKFIISDVGNTACEVICSSEPTTPTSITIPSSVEINGVECSVTSIRYDGFSGCSNLTNIAIPNSVTSIGSFAFAYSNLTNIEIPNSVTYIGNNAFYCCFGLTGIEIPNSVTSIGDEAFCGCSGLTNIEIPNSVTSIGNSAFSGCYGLTSIEIPNSVTSIGDHAFSSCSGLTNIEIPNSVTSIGNEVFRYCSGLTSISVVSGNPIYDSRENCNAIIETSTNTLIFGCQNTIIPNSVTSIGNSAFHGCSGLTSIEIPSSVTSIGNSAFSGCTGLTSIEIPNSVTTIGDEAFKYCSLLSIKCFSEDVPETSTTAFASCPSEMNIQVPEGSVDSYKSAEPWKNYNVTKMYPYQNGDFIVIDYEGYSLKFTIINVETAECDVICSTKPTTATAIAIPSSVEINGVDCSVTYIRHDGFSGCSNLTSIEIPNSVTYIEVMPFYGCDVLERITVEVDNTVYDSRDNCNAIVETETNTLVSGCKNTIIPNSVTSIGYGAFYGCSGLTSIEIPNSVTTIGNSAFYNCSGLTSIEIPNSVTSIGTSAFLGCSGLTSIKIPNSVTYIEDSAFKGCSGLTNIKIPNSVTFIGDNAFKGCSGLTSVEIPSSVTAIGNSAFDGCLYLATIKCHAEDVPETYSYFGDTFSNCPSDMTIYVPAQSLSLYQAAEPWNNYNIVALPDVGDNTIIDYDGYSLQFTVTNVEPAECEVKCSTQPTTKTAITIPSSVEINGVECSVISIGNEAFDSYYYLTSIDIPNSVTTIGDRAFFSCGLTSIEIPNNVTSIGDWAFFNCTGLTSIEIPDSVTSIGDNAFYQCCGLTGIEIPNSVISIGDWAFYGCSELTSLEILNGVTSIGDNAFSFCSNLTEIEIPNSVISIGDNAFSGCKAMESMTVEAGNTVYDSRENCNAIIETETNTLVSGCENTIIPNSVTSIGDFAFDCCYDLTSIEIPNSVTSIGNTVFRNCFGLTSIEIPSSVTSIGNTVFNNCSGLTSIEIPNSVTSIGYGVLQGTTRLTSIIVATDNPNYDSRDNSNAIIEISTNTLIAGCENSIIPNSVTSIGNDAFSNCSGLTSIEIPNSVTTIGNSAFSGCFGLTSIEIPNSVTSIGNDAFSNCSGLTSIEIPNSVTSIGNGAFIWCSRLTSIEIPNSVTSIGNEAFRDCYNLTSIEIPNSVISIGNESFYNCSKLMNIKCNAVSVPETNETAFNSCPSDMTIYVPSNSLSLYQASEPWNNYNILPFCSVGDFEYVDNDSYILKYTIISSEPAECDVICSSEPTEEVSITLPSVVTISGKECLVTSIGDGAFYHCSRLTSIEIPSSVTSIGDHAFYHCSGLTSIEIPNSVTTIGNYAFSGCAGLTGIEIPNSVTSIGDRVFSSCSGLTSISVESGNPMYDSRNNCNAIIETSTNTLIFGYQNTIIPNSVTTIGYQAFYNCYGLTSIEIPNSVTTIGNSAFSGCTGLTSIEIPNSVTSIGDWAFSGCTGLTSIEIPNSVTSIRDCAFYDCSGLTSIEIPNSVTTIGNSAFLGCTGLTSIEIPNSVTTIGDWAFAYSSLTSIEIPNSVTTIGNSAFLGCTGLTSIEIPNSVTSIGDGAFYSCSNLTTIKCHAESVPETYESAFYDCPSDMTIQVPANSLSLYQAAEPWNNFNIVAGFNSNINVSSNITEGGFVEGGGNYQDGTEVTVSAYVNPNYGFLYWSENDEIVSYSPNYSFIVSEDRNLVANFAINHWIPDYTIYPNFMAVTGVVQIDGIEQRDSNIEIGAFCGDELRGSNRLIYESEYDRYFLYLTIYGKDDDEISFRIYDNSEETELKLYYNETMNFIVDDIVGNVSDPKIFNFTTDYIHRQQLTSNWNWYSTFVDVSGREGFEMMTENLGEQAIQIKSQSVFSNYNAGKWNGGLNTVSTGNMYMIKMSEPIELSMSGVIVEPSEFPIVINPNWKWIPYPVQEEMDIASAFAGFTPNDGDIVKSQDGFTQYYQGIGWNGSLNTMMPGEGYMYQNTSGEEKILYYPTQGKNRNALKANMTTENNYWKPEVTKYPTNMNVIAVVNNSSDDYEIGAFCNGECRGGARPIYIEELDKHIVFMTVYGDEEETIYLKYYDINNDEEYAVSDVFTFSVNAVLGNTMNPYVISLVHANVGEISTDELNIYPNPAKVNDEIYFTKEYEKVEIYNALGVKIAEYENSDYIDGIEDAGVYVVKITDNGMSRYDRIIVK